MTFEAPQRLYTPWRMNYVTNPQKKTTVECVFCDMLSQDPAADPDNRIIYRSEHCFVVMNIYPYNTGHLMVLPREHTAKLADLKPIVQAEMMHLTAYLTELLESVMRPDGFNIGINQGKAAGSGIDAHLHMHIVPRWHGDSNFMAVCGDTRVLPEELHQTYQRLVEALKANPPQQ